jgi:putative oxidoreductase
MATRTETRGSVLEPLDRLAPHAHWLPRLAFAGIFLYMGINKLAGPAGFAEMMGLPVFVAWLVALGETAAGALILLGGAGQDGATRLAGLIVAPIMVGAIAMVHWPNWHFMDGGAMFQTLILAISLYWVVRGNRH